MKSLANPNFSTIGALSGGHCSMGGAGRTDTLLTPAFERGLEFLSINLLHQIHNTMSAKKGMCDVLTDFSLRKRQNHRQGFC